MLNKLPFNILCVLEGINLLQHNYDIIRNTITLRWQAQTEMYCAETGQSFCV